MSSFMDNIKEMKEKYLESLKKRAKESHVYKSHQSVGLDLAEILKDFKYKSFYMKLAKEYDNTSLLQLAASIAERKDISNKGAYFMTALKMSKLPKRVITKLL